MARVDTPMSGSHWRSTNAHDLNWPVSALSSVPTRQSRLIRQRIASTVRDCVRLSVVSRKCMIRARRQCRRHRLRWDCIDRCSWRRDDYVDRKYSAMIGAHCSHVYTMPSRAQVDAGLRGQLCCKNFKERLNRTSCKRGGNSGGIILFFCQPA